MIFFSLDATDEMRIFEILWNFLSGSLINEPISSKKESLESVNADILLKKIRTVILLTNKTR